MVSEVGSRKQRLAFHTAYCFNISCSLLVACQMGGILASSSLLPQNYPSPSPKLGLLYIGDGKNCVNISVIMF